MKKLLLCTALLTAYPLVFAQAASTPAPAEAAAAKEPAAPFKSDMAEAVFAAGQEMKEVLGDGKGNPIILFDKIAAYQYTAPTQEKLRKVFGLAQPFPMVRSATSDGGVRYNLSVKAGSYADVDELKWNWSAPTMDAVIDKNGRDMITTGNWSKLEVDTKKTTIRLNGMNLEGKQTRDSNDIWVGKARVAIASIDVAEKNQSATMSMEKFSLESGTLQNGKSYDVFSEFRIASVKVMGTEIEGVHMAMRFVNVDMKAVEALGKAVNKRSLDNLKAGKTKETEVQQLAALAPQFKAFGKGMAAQGTTMALEDLSFGFGGHRAVIKGKVALAGAVDSDFDNFAALGKKVVARFDISVPVAMISSVSRSLASKQTPPGTAPNEAALDQASQGMTDMVVGKLMTGGYAKLDNGVLTSTIEFKGGQLTVNDKAIALPKTAAKPAGKAAAKPAGKPAKKPASKPASN